jgi:hypothetical protein
MLMELETFGTPYVNDYLQDMNFFHLLAFSHTQSPKKRRLLWKQITHYKLQVLFLQFISGRVQFV